MGGLDLASAVAGAEQRQAQPIVARHDAEFDVLHPLARDTALLEVGARLAATLACELSACSAEGFRENAGPALGRSRGAVERAGVNAGARSARARTAAM